MSGNGQRELAESIFGLRSIDAGTVTVDGHDITGEPPRAVRDHGVAYVPEERMRDGAIGEFIVAENLILVDHDREPYARYGFLNRSAIDDHSAQLVADYNVKTPSLETGTSSLSGGNIQKVVIAREFSADADVLVVAQPTRGVDIGAAEYIHERLLEQRSKGAAILLISEDLEEVIQLSDRIVVLLEGEIQGEVGRADANVTELGLLMSGVTEPA